jgi:hypothetical protein
MAQRGRPSKLTPEKQQEFLNALSRCVYFESAAHLAEIHPSTIRRWMALGRKQRKGKYAAL